MRELLAAALALFCLTACLCRKEAAGGASSEVAASGLGAHQASPETSVSVTGPVDTGGFLIYTPPTDGTAKRLAGAYWRQRENDGKRAPVRESVHRWTFFDVSGLDHTKVTTFHPTDPMLSESGGPYVLERVMSGDTLDALLDAVEAVAGVRPAEGKSDTHFRFWGYFGQLDKVPRVLVLVD